MEGAAQEQGEARTLGRILGAAPCGGLRARVPAKHRPQGLEGRL